MTEEPDISLLRPYLIPWTGPAGRPSLEIEAQVMTTRLARRPDQLSFERQEIVSLCRSRCGR